METTLTSVQARTDRTAIESARRCARTEEAQKAQKARARTEALRRRAVILQETRKVVMPDHVRIQARVALDEIERAYNLAPTREMRAARRHTAGATLVWMDD